jgi:fibronectin type 3 domain-containing protein
MRKVLVVLSMMMLATFSFGELTAKTKVAAGPSVALSCTQPSSGRVPNSYNFYRSATSGGPYTLVGSATACAYSDTTVVFGATYFYVATGVNTVTCPSGQTCESAFSNEVTAVIPSNPIPNPPTGLTVGTIVAKKVQLKWTAPKSQAGVAVEAYTVWRGVKPTLPAPGQIARTLVPSYTDPTCKGTCYYEVKAMDLVGTKAVTTGPSNVVKAVN